VSRVWHNNVHVYSAAGLDWRITPVSAPGKGHEVQGQGQTQQGQGLGWHWQGFKAKAKANNSGLKAKANVTLRSSAIC